METDRVQPDAGSQREPNDAADGRRERSTIDFPYMDLGTAIDVATGIFERNGGADVQTDELAAQLNLSASSSGFRTRLAAARTFGLIQSSRGSEVVSLTDLGLKIVDESWKRRAKADAFLQVELFRAVYDQFKGSQLPPAAALERRMQEFGVAPKQAERARQVFERSAETAGYFESGRDRLVRPANLGAQRDGDNDSKKRSGGGGDDGGSDDGDDGSVKKARKVDPIIDGLLARLPRSGEVWPEAERKLWLELLAGSFRLIYQDTDKGRQKDDSDSMDDSRTQNVFE